jgi:hypothetical protein
MWRCEVQYKLTDVSEKYIAAILKADKQEVGVKQMAEVHWCFGETYFLLAGYLLGLLLYNTLKDGSKTSLNCYHLYISGHYPSSCFYLKSRLVCISKHRVSEFYLHLQVKPTHLGPINRTSTYLRIPAPAPRWGVQAKHSTNHLRELRKH